MIFSTVKPVLICWADAVENTYIYIVQLFADKVAWFNSQWTCWVLTGLLNFFNKDAPFVYPPLAFIHPAVKLSSFAVLFTRTIEYHSFPNFVYITNQDADFITIISHTDNLLTGLHAKLRKATQQIVFALW